MNGTLHMGLRRVNFFEARNDKSGSFASAILGTCKDIASCKDNRDCFFLNGGGFLKTLLKNAHEELSF